MSEQPDHGGAIALGTISISYAIDPDGQPDVGMSFAEDLPLVTQLGMLALAKDTLLRADEWDDDYDEEDDE
ncbi:hypothetical protein [Nesterenkonia suensis]